MYKILRKNVICYTVPYLNKEVKIYNNNKNTTKLRSQPITSGKYA